MIISFSQTGDQQNSHGLHNRSFSCVVLLFSLRLIVQCVVSLLFFSRYNALTAPLSMRDPLLGLGTKPCALRPRLSGNKASEEHQLRSHETNKLCAHNRKDSMQCTVQGKGNQLRHLTRKGPLQNQKDCCVISQERDCCVISQERDRTLRNKLLCHLTRKGPLLEKTTKDPNQNCRNRTQNASGSLEPCHNMRHGFATRDSYHRRFCITSSAVTQCFKRMLKHVAYCPGDSTRSVQWVMNQDKPGRVLRSFVLDHSWTPFHQRTS